VRMSPWTFSIQIIPALLMQTVTVMVCSLFPW
jgi:hypothetical protein